MYISKKVKSIKKNEDDFNNSFIPRYKPLIFITCTKKGLDYFYHDRDELFQIGLVALWDAYINFDEERGANIRTFVINTINYYLQNNKSFSQGFTASTRARFNRILSGKSKNYTPLPKFSSIDDVNIQSPSKDEDIEYWHDVDTLTATLNNREEFFIRCLLSGESYSEIAERECLSRERVKQIAISAKTKIKHNMEIDGEIKQSKANAELYLKITTPKETMLPENPSREITPTANSKSEDCVNEMANKKNKPLSCLTLKEKHDALPEEEKEYIENLNKINLDLRSLAPVDRIIVEYLFERRKFSYIANKFGKSRSCVIDRLDCIIKFSNQVPL